MLTEFAQIVFMRMIRYIVKTLPVVWFKIGHMSIFTNRLQMDE